MPDHPALAFTCVHGAVKFSSPKNQAQPVGEPVEVSVNVTETGAEPVRGVAVKLARGFADLKVADIE